MPLRATPVVAVLGVLLALGCSTKEEQCQKYCAWESRCVQGAVSTEDCTQDCVRDADDRTSDCQEAFDDFANCADKNESCPGVDTQCQREAARFINKCDCTNPTGPLKDLCQQI
jgi:hypothetical protein